MANLKLLLVSIFLIFAIITSSISTEEIESKTEDAQISEEQIPKGQEGEGEDEDEVNPGEGKENLLDENDNVDMKELGFDTKEFLTRAEMKTLFEKVLLKIEITDPEEKSFYVDLIEGVIKEMPEIVQSADVRNYFEIQYVYM